MRTYEELLDLIAATPAPRGRETNPALTATRRAFSTALDVRHGLTAGWGGVYRRWDCPPGNAQCPLYRELMRDVTRAHPEPSEARVDAVRQALDAHNAAHRHPEEDAEEMIEALDEMILKLAKFRRTGRPKKGA